MPDARLIMVLRDPVDRAYSNWAHLWADGLEPVSDFLSACAEETTRKEAGWAPIWRYLETGRYGQQIRHLRTLFDPEQILIIRYKEFVDEPAATREAVCRFLGVEEGVIEEAPPRNVGGFVQPTVDTRAASFARLTKRRKTTAGTNNEIVC